MNRIFLIVFFFACLLNSCTNDKIEVNPCAYDASDLKYNGLVKNIINTNCAANTDCHGSPQGQHAGGDLTSYAQVKEKITGGSFNNRVFILKDMPQGTELSECDFKRLKDWYEAGYPE